MKKTLLGVLSLFLVSMSLSAQYYTEDFEAGAPAGWTAENAWTHGNAAALGSAYFNPEANTTNFMCVNDDGLGNGVDGSGRLITAPIDIPETTNRLALKHSAYFINGDYQGADETAKVFASADGGGTWTELQDVGASAWADTYSELTDYAGQSIQLAFEYVDGDNWNYGYCVDNIEIVDAPDPDVRLNYIDFHCEAGAVGGTTSFYGSVTNNSLDPLTTFDVAMSDGTTATIDGLNIGAFSSGQFTVDTEVVIAEGSNNMEVTLSTADADMTNNSATDVVVGVVPVEGSGVLVEEGTGTWCPWCPRGTYYVERYSDCFKDNFVGVAVHNGANDPMLVSDYDAAVGAFPGFTGYPGVIFNKTNVIDPSEIGNPSITAMTSQPMALVTIGAEFDEATRMLTVSVEGSEFASDMSGVKFFAALTEDGVTEGGASSGGTLWTQANNYAGGGNGPMGGFEFLPGAAPVADYNHTARAMMGTFFGTNATDMTAGGGGGYIFSSTQVPDNFNMDNMHIVGALVNANNNVINVMQTNVADAVERGLFVSSNKDLYDNTLAQVFPNPVSDVAHIQIDVDASAVVTLDVFDMLGRKIERVQLGTAVGNSTFDYNTSNLSNGVYNLHLTVGDKFVSKKITVAK